jgi:hypothetical protein
VALSTPRVHRHRHRRSTGKVLLRDFEVEPQWVDFLVEKKFMPGWPEDRKNLEKIKEAMRKLMNHLDQYGDKYLRDYEEM